LYRWLELKAKASNDWRERAACGFKSHPNFFVKNIRIYMELNEFGLKVWKHKTNKRIFLEQSYRWKDNLVLLDETEGRQVIDSYTASTYNYSAWEPMTKEEYDKVKSKYREIYE
jgi:hypothetical protein